MRLRLVIFDCDGVLVDSEPVANRVVAETLAALGWAMTAEESRSRFLGLTLTAMRPLIEARVGPLPENFATALSARLVAAQARECRPMPGAAALLRATTALGLAWRVASNSSHAEMAAKFVATGLDRLVEGRLHSADDLPPGRGKPAPDLFLEAAAAEGVAPAACVVVEDSVPGVRGAIAAGMACIGFDPAGGGEALRAAGAATVVRALAELPALFRVRMAGDAA